MKIAGLTQIPKNEKVVPITRTDRTYYFLSYAVEDSEFFDKLVPRPQPKVTGGEVGKPKVGITTKSFTDQQNDYYEKFSNYLVIASLKACAFDTNTLNTETGEESIVRTRNPIVWDSVKLEDPTTWANWEDELRNFGLSNAEINRLRTSCAEANSLTNSMVEEAMADFLRNPPVALAPGESISQGALGSTPSGGVAPASA